MTKTTLRWTAVRNPPLVWRRWDDESVVFCPASGDTHLLDLLATEGLQCLEGKPLSATELCSELAVRLDEVESEQLLQYSKQLITRFDELGLLEFETA